MGGQYIKMILVMLGTQNNSFNRLLEQIDNLIQEEKIQEEVIVQAGYTKYKSKNMEIFDLISKDEIQRYQQEASYVITHGGAGSIITSLKYGKKVIAVPRKHEYGEHVNNHQIQIIKDFTDNGYIIGIENVEDLHDAIIKSKTFEPIKYQPNNSKMLKIIENFIENI